jgi:hypothetical protein
MDLSIFTAAGVPPTTAFGGNGTTDTVDEFICPLYRVMSNLLRALKSIFNNITRSIYYYCDRSSYTAN